MKFMLNPISDDPLHRAKCLNHRLDFFVSSNQLVIRFNLDVKLHLVIADVLLMHMQLIKLIEDTRQNHSATFSIKL